MRNIPNILSAFRICLVPCFITVYFSEASDAKIYSVLIYALASFTDFLDGFIARKHKLVTNLGRVLDPLGDKLMTTAVLVCIAIDGVIPYWILGAVVGKEVLMAAGGLVLHKKFPGQMPPSNILGKMTTVLFFLVCIALMLFRSIPSQTATIMVSAAVGLMLMAFGSYVMTFYSLVRKASLHKKNNGK